ncbi:uncharacterized protein VICG_00064 [Vittaforma corneae ATCC 50505]|uniref:Rab-GAP TBC domain-containing protein n=1 Tax=Vittaforma corneae (strain ATCC 50505) TaxID=993615 RepID=L2GQ62_VITCO|nr:uncharacterized protein VICG_00064 [Vittaforma corneae ATCC 50505]ELA42749.1 hypothetical protein VICG_00064 [Vittaforma corneae ATCC 50505]
MSRETLLTTLKKFEEEPKIEIEKIKKEEIYTIMNDLNRSDFKFSKLHKSFLATKLYLFLLQKTFDNFPISYFQGMMEIAAVLVDAYFQDKAASFRLKHKDSDEHAPPALKIGEISDKEKSMFEEFLASNLDLYNKFRNGLINILIEKFIFFTKDEFRNYNENNKIFIKLMKDKFKRVIEPTASIKYMNHTLTFFKRIAGNSDVAFKFFNLVLNSDPSIVFSILAVYIDKVDHFNSARVTITDENRNQYMVTSLEENDIRNIIGAQEMFLKCKSGMETDRQSKSTYIFLGAAVGCAVLALLISRWNDRDNK